MPRYLGQHFLRDKKIVLAIKNAISSIHEKTQSQNLIEIGPGKGALTKYLVDISKDFSVIEKDQTMKEKLLTILDKNQIIRSDVLERNYKQRYTKKGASKHVVCGNLPYYITSPILRMFFEKETRAEGGVFLIQKEVADKIKHNAEKKSYLRWLLNNYYHVSYIKTVSAKSFSPPPKVQSAVIKIEKKLEPSYKNTDDLLQILDYISPYKRKTLGKIQKIVGFEKMSIPESLRKLRTEDLTWDFMTQMSIK